MTERQRRVLSAILAHERRNGVPPTYRELGRALRIASPNGVRRHLQALERKGYLRLRATARGISVAAEATGLPILGRIAAGRPLEALENYEGTVDFGKWPETFALRVAGDSMVDAGIQNGDLVVVHPGPNVEDGRIAAVAVGDDATVKRIRRERGGLRLIPANPNYSEEVVSGEDVRVLGRVVGLVRTF